MRSRTVRVATTAAYALAAIALSVVATSLLRLDGVPPPLAIAILCVGGLAALRPAQGLLVVGAFVPLANYLLRGWNFGTAWAEAVVIAFGAGWFFRRLLRHQDDPLLPQTLRLPMIAFACVLGASVAVQMSVDQARLGTADFTSWLLRYFSRDYFVSGSDRYLHAAAFLLEGLLLFAVCVRVAAADGKWAPRLEGVLVASTAAAAAVNLQQLVISARRSADFWGTLAQHVATARINVHYADVNAAGSAFALLFCVSVGLAARPRGRLWAIGGAFLALGLLLTGSRTALFACPVALAALALVAARKRVGRRGRLAIAAVSVILLIAAIAAVYAPRRGNQKASSIAARVRVEMARTTLRMVADDPLFGIGLGEFYQRTGEFSSPELLKLFPPAQHENAHNNFLQILAETGLVGLAVFLWLLVAALYVAARPLSGGSSDPVAWGGIAGLLAFLLTCLGGHPLLTREAGYTFWMVLGIAAGHASRLQARERSYPPPSPWLTRATALLVAALALTVPFRAATARAGADFEHLGIGLSPHWETADDGERYRSAVTEASIFVPGETAFRFRVRALSDRMERLEVRIAGRTADIVTLVPHQWTEIAMPPRNDRADTRFTRMDLRIIDAGQRPVTIWISKVEQVGH